MVDIKMNLGQIDALKAVLNNNNELCNKISISELSYFTSLIVKNGRNSQYLEIFELILRIQNTYEINKKIVQVLLDETKSQMLNVDYI